MSLPSLDGYFSDKTTGKLKREMVFVVNNGPAEQPPSPDVSCLTASYTS